MKTSQVHCRVCDSLQADTFAFKLIIYVSLCLSSLLSSSSMLIIKLFFLYFNMNVCLYLHTNIVVIFMNSTFCSPDFKTLLNSTTLMLMCINTPFSVVDVSESCFRL